MKFIGNAHNFPIYNVKHKLLQLIFISPNHIQVIIKRCTIKKVNQPDSQKNYFSNVTRLPNVTL